MYRSKQLITMLSRLGHCETYDFSLELETALVQALDESPTTLPPQILTGDANKVVHSEWDNLNKITTNVHGSNVVNSTAGILVQEVQSGFEETAKPKLPTSKRTKARSQRFEIPETLAPVHIYKKVGPKFPDGFIFTAPEEDTYQQSLQEYQLWMLARAVGSSGETQLVPGIGGFISATGKAPPRKSTIEYFTPIDQPFTEYSVIEELLKRSEKATKEVGQKYTLLTFDLGGVMKAMPLIWQNPDRYKYHVVTPGAFHTCMNYMGTLTGRKCLGSGYAEILIEAGLVTTGCLDSVLKGKAYAKALFCLKTVTEALERLLLEKFAQEEKIEVSSVSLLSLVQNCSRENLDQAMQDPGTLSILEKYVAYEHKVRQGHLGKTAMFWMSVIDHTRLILMLQYSIKTNNLSLFHKCNRDMADLFFAFDGQNYSRFVFLYT